MARRSGHFRFESGHHGDRWLEPDLLVQRPTALRPFAIALAQRLRRRQRFDLVCGPLTGGAFLAQMVAEQCDVGFAFAERGTHSDLVACGARPVAFGTLIALGDWSTNFAAEHDLAIEALERLGNNLWTPEECPLCAAAEPLQDLF